MEFRLVTDLHVTNEERPDNRMYLFMAQVRDKIDKGPFQTSAYLLIAWNPLLLHPARPNSNDRGREDSGDPEE